MSVKTANYQLHEEVQVYRGPSDTKVLPAGTFVSPIELRYVPKHVIDEQNKSPFNSFNAAKQVYCYTQYGIIAINRDALRAT